MLVLKSLSYYAVFYVFLSFVFLPVFETFEHFTGFTFIFIIAWLFTCVLKQPWLVSLGLSALSCNEVYFSMAFYAACWVAQKLVATDRSLLCSVFSFPQHFPKYSAACQHYCLMQSIRFRVIKIGESFLCVSSRGNHFCGEPFLLVCLGSYSFFPSPSFSQRLLWYSSAGNTPFRFCVSGLIFMSSSLLKNIFAW